MAEEIYRPWQPIEGIPDPVYCEALHDDYEYLRILLRGADPKSRMLRIRFESVVAYRNINESYRIRTWSCLRGQTIPPLLTVENSSWIAWLKEESGGVLEHERLIHYAIFTPEDCIDVVAALPPEVEWLNDG
jgi:hypothetical protein